VVLKPTNDLDVVRVGLRSCVLDTPSEKPCREGILGERSMARRILVLPTVENVLVVQLDPRWFRHRISLATLCRLR
jgi:hypothetical protein